jgi:hypothetical protein
VILLERESQLGSLRQYADEARLGTGRFVLISGEAGVGKTSLLEELDRGLLDATRAWGGCDGLFTPRPLAPLRDIARELGGDLAETVRDVSREEVFDAVLRRLETLDGLTVLVVEDVHWADEATLDLLRFLARRLVRLPVLVLVTFRDDALAPGDPLRQALGELAGQRCTRRIDLPPLTPEAVRRLAEGTSYAPDELYELTAGNPFFVTEVVGSGGDQIPASARDAVLARAARLSTVARATLDLAALDSSRIDTELIARAGATGPEAFDELVTSGLLKIDGRTMRFRHELARRAIESEVPPHRRLAGHRALHDVLTQQGCDDEARLAYHAEGAGEPQLVRRHAPLAARRAAAMGALPRGGSAVRAGPEVSTGRSTRPGRAPRRVRRPARARRQLAASRRQLRAGGSTVARPRRRTPRGVRLRAPRDRLLAAVPRARGRQGHPPRAGAARAPGPGSRAGADPRPACAGSLEG